MKEVKSHRRVEKLKQEITLQYDYTHEDAFASIDDFHYGYVDFSNLKRFLKRNGYIPTNKDLAAVIRRLDLDADSKLKKGEFIEGIKPAEPYSKVEIS
jgi:Ca2+-binding EF-hand superfamily protein